MRDIIECYMAPSQMSLSPLGESEGATLSPLGELEGATYMHIIHIVLRLWREGLELALLVFVVPEIGAEVDGDDVFGEGGVGDYGVVLTLRDWGS